MIKLYKKKVQVLEKLSYSILAILLEFSERKAMFPKYMNEIKINTIYELIVELELNQPITRKEEKIRTVEILIELVIKMFDKILPYEFGEYGLFAKNKYENDIKLLKELLEELRTND